MLIHFQVGLESVTTGSNLAMEVWMDGLGMDNVLPHRGEEHAK